MSGHLNMNQKELMGPNSRRYTNISVYVTNGLGAQRCGKIRRIFQIN